MGDLLLSIPLILNIRKKFPTHQLALFCRKGLGEFYLKTKLVDQIFEIDKSEPSAWKKIKNELQKKSYDYIFSPHESFRTATIVKSLKANKKIGYSKWWTFWAYNESYPRNWDLPESIRQLQLLNGIDSEIKKEIETLLATDQPSSLLRKLYEPFPDIPPWASMSLVNWLKNYERPERLKEIFKNIQQPIIFFAPGSVWPTKRWIPEHFVELGVSLVKEGYSIILLGAPNERELAQTISDRIPGSLNLAGQASIFESWFLYEKGVCLICNDSGSMHLGAAAEIPTVAIFGPTSKKFGFFPWQKKSIIVEKSLPCRPCGKHGHKVCPIKTHECMKLISAQDVLNAIHQLMSKV